MRRIFGTSYQMLKVQCAPGEKVIGIYWDATKQQNHDITNDDELFTLEKKRESGLLVRQGFYAVPIK